MMMMMMMMLQILKSLILMDRLTTTSLTMVVSKLHPFVVFSRAQSALGERYQNVTSRTALFVRIEMNQS